MNSQITSKLEINLLDATTTPQIVSEFAIKFKIPAIVSSPEYIAPLISHRAMMGGQYKIISALDFPKGTNYAMDKLFRANPDFVHADGFEVLLSAGKSEIQSKNEMKAIHSYLKANRPLSEIRWVVRMNTADPEETNGILKNMKNYPPSFVRVDPHLVTPRATVEALASQVEQVGASVPYPIKVSGNIDIDRLEALKGLKGLKRFDVSMKQAEAIVQALKIEAASARPSPKVKPGPAVKRVGNTKRIRL
jgi:hypothetical protein